MWWSFVDRLWNLVWDLQQNYCFAVCVQDWSSFTNIDVCHLNFAHIDFAHMEYFCVDRLSIPSCRVLHVSYYGYHGRFDNRSDFSFASPTVEILRIDVMSASSNQIAAVSFANHLTNVKEIRLEFKRLEHIRDLEFYWATLIENCSHESFPRCRIGKERKVTWSVNNDLAVGFAEIFFTTIFKLQD